MYKAILFCCLWLSLSLTTFAAEDNIVDESNHVYSYDEMVADIQQLDEKYPDRIEVSTIGTSVDSRPIYQIVIGSKNAKNAIFVMSTIHGREWMNSWMLMDSLEVSLDNWNNPAPCGETFKDVFNDCCIYLIPMVNPDGVSISQFGIESIRREEIKGNLYNLPGADNPKRWKANADGVDLNRQFAYGWNSAVTVGTPASEMFNGTAPFTEPEALAIKAALDQRKFTVGVTYHSMEGAIYWDLGQEGDLRERTKALATHCKNITGYKLGCYSSCKGLEYNYMNFCKDIPTVCIETGTVQCPLPYSQWKSVWNKNHLLMVALAGCYQ